MDRDWPNIHWMYFVKLKINRTSQQQHVAYLPECVLLQTKKFSLLMLSPSHFSLYSHVIDVRCVSSVFVTCRKQVQVQKKITCNQCLV